MEVHGIGVVLLNILAILLMFVTYKQLPPPDENHFPWFEQLRTVLRSRCVFPDITTSPLVLEKHW